MSISGLERLLSTQRYAGRQSPIAASLITGEQDSRVWREQHCHSFQSFTESAAEAIVLIVTPRQVRVSLYV